jgi:hypothetical protein
MTAGGWEWSGVTQFWSGTPCLSGGGTGATTNDACDLFSSGNLGTGGGYQNPSYSQTGGQTFGHIRPDYIGGPIMANHTHNVGAGQFPMWFNPSAFAVPALGSYGNFRRNSIYGPGVNNWNMSLFKNINIHEDMRIQLRFEAYNVFNHTQWGTVNNGLAAPTAGTQFTGAYAGASGQITSVRDPRLLQLGGKFYF